MDGFNGYFIMRDMYLGAGEDRKAEIFNFLGSCDQEDVYTLFDSSCFNEIAKDYLRRAVRELIEEGKLEEEEGRAIRNRFSLLFDEKKAAEICEG